MGCLQFLEGGCSSTLTPAPSSSLASRRSSCRLHHDISLGLGERRGKPLLSTPLSFYQDITASPVLVAELWGPPLLPHLVPDPEPR